MYTCSVGTSFSPCIICRRHVRSEEPCCPFCGARRLCEEQALPSWLVARSSAATWTISAVLLFAGCKTNEVAPEPAGGSAGQTPVENTSAGGQAGSGGSPAQAGRGGQGGEAGSAGGAAGQGGTGGNSGSGGASGAGARPLDNVSPPLPTGPATTPLPTHRPATKYGIPPHHRPAPKYGMSPIDFLVRWSCSSGAGRIAEECDRGLVRDDLGMERPQGWLTLRARRDLDGDRVFGAGAAAAVDG